MNANQRGLQPAQLECKIVSYAYDKASYELRSSRCGLSQQGERQRDVRATISRTCYGKPSYDEGHAFGAEVAWDCRRVVLASTKST